MHMEKFTIPQLRRHIVDREYRTIFERLHRDGLELDDDIRVELYGLRDTPDIKETGDMINRNSYNGRYSTEKIIEYYFRHPETKNFVLKQDAAVRGIKSLCPLDDATYFSLINIDEGLRNRGLSKLLSSLGTLYPLNMGHDIVIAKTRSPLSIKLGCRIGFLYGRSIRPGLKKRCEDVLSEYFKKDVSLSEDFIWTEEDMDPERAELRVLYEQDDSEIDSFFSKHMGRNKSAILVKELDQNFDRASLFE